MIYFSANDRSTQEITAGLRAGTVERWRLDAAGIQWYSQHAPIHGVPLAVTDDCCEVEIVEVDDEV